MGNIIFGLDNYLDEATLTAGSEDANMPVENLQDEILAIRYRSAGINPANTYIDIDLGTEKEIGLLGIFNHLAGRISTCRWLITTGAAATGTVIYDTDDVVEGGIPLWGRAYNSLSMRWEQAHWWFGQISDAEADTYYQNCFHLPASTQYGRYIRLYIDDSLSAIAYFELGRLYIGPKDQLPYNFVYGSSEGTIDDSPRMNTLGGVVVKERRRPIRTAQYNIEEIPERPINYRSLFKQIQNRIGKTRQFVVIPQPDDVIETTFTAMMCSQSSINDVTYKSVGVSSTRINVVEER